MRSAMLPCPGAVGHDSPSSKHVRTILALAAIVLTPAAPSAAQSFTIRDDFDSADNWINAAPPGLTPPNHTTSIVSNGDGSAWQWDITANQPNSFLVGLPLAQPDPNLNALIAPMLDTSAQAKFHVDGGQPNGGGLGVQVAIVSRFSLGSLDQPQGYCLLVGDGRMDLARFDFNGPAEPFQILTSLEGADFVAAGGFDINPDQDDVDVIMRLDVINDSDGSATLGGWIWDASNPPDPSFLDAPMLTAVHANAFPAGILGLEVRTNVTTEAMTTTFDWIQATGTVPEPCSFMLLLVVGGVFLVGRHRSR